MRQQKAKNQPKDIIIIVEERDIEKPEVQKFEVNLEKVREDE